MDTNHDIIENNEFLQIVELFSTWVGLIHNKIYNPIGFFIVVIQNKDLRHFICESLDINYYRFVQKMCEEYPTVGVSKRVINALNDKKIA